MTSGRRLERDLEATCNRIAIEADWEPCKLDRIRGRRGRPDQVYLGPNGIYFVVEFKLPGEKPRPQQLYRHAQLARAGRPVHVITTVEQFEALLCAFSDPGLRVTSTPL